MIVELLNTLIQNKISPNQYYLLNCINNSVAPIYINVEMELRLLRPLWISSDNKLTQKSIDFIEFIENTYSIKSKRQIKQVLGNDAITNINIYRELFPKGKLPSGAPARVTVEELTKKFTWFFNTYKSKYSWDLIIEVTKNYIEQYEQNGYLYMRNSSYFVSRQDNNKTIISDLATECELFLEQDEQPIINNKIIRKNG